MSSIRKQSIIASLVIYFGFAIGLLNTFFFTKEGLFTPEQYGLISIFMAIASLMTVLANIAVPNYIFKFYHYYKDHLPPSKNDMLSWSLLFSTLGFLMVLVLGLFFKDLVIQKFSTNSYLLVMYYSWLFPFSFGLSVYTILETYIILMGKAVVANFLREVQWRLLVTVLIVLFFCGIIQNFDQFIKAYTFTYIAIALVLLSYLIKSKKVFLTFKVSKVSRRYFSKILKLCLYFYSGTVIFTASQVFDSIVIAAKLDNGLAKAGIFGLAQLMGAVIQAPQRGIIAASVTHLSKAWKEKNMELIQRVYQRSSINQLIFATGIFALIALNYKHAILSLHLNPDYLLGFQAFILLGLTRVVDMGSGVNSQIIITSTVWKFELISGIVLVLIMLPLTYLLAIRFDIMGPALANLISITIYNAIRIIFLWKRYKLNPFTIQTIYTLFIAAVIYFLCYFAFNEIDGFGGLCIRSAVFVITYASIVVSTKLSPDVTVLWHSFMERFQKSKSH